MPEVVGPDGQRYQFPEGTSPDVMKQAMAKRYPKPEAPAPQVNQAQSSDPLAGDGVLFENPDRYQGPTQKRESTYNQRVVEGLSDPTVWRDNVSAALSGINNLAYFGADDELANLLGEKTGLNVFSQYEGEQDRLRQERPAVFQGGQMAAGMVPTGLATQATQSAGILRNAATAGATNAAIGAPLGFNDADGPGEDRLQAAQTTALVSGGAGALLGGGGAALSKAFGGVSSREMQAAAAEISALDNATIRPQALKAFNRLLSKSGLSDSDILRLHDTVRNRQASLQGQSASAETRKRTFQHYLEVLADDEGSALYNPQAASNILMTVQERANSAMSGDGSRGIVGAAVKADRASQVPFLQESAQGVAKGTRAGTEKLVKDTRSSLGGQYSEALAPANISQEGQRAALDMIESIRPLMDGPSGLKVQAAAEGVDVDSLINSNPMAALHWMQSAARRKAQSSDPNRTAYQALRNRALPVIEEHVPAYRDLRTSYASNEGLDTAKTFGDRLFGGAQSNMMNNPGLRGQMVDEFNALTPQEQQIALVSIRDQALGKLAGGAEGAPARLSQLNTQNALDFLEQVGQKQFADDIRAISRENQLLSVADAGNPLRQSATFSNAQSRAEAPALYNSRVANAVDNSTPGTMLGEGMLMAFAPHYQGAYAAYRGGRMAAAAGLGTRKKTLEDMTRFLMGRNDTPAAPQNAFNQTPPTSGGAPAQVTNAFAGQDVPITQAPQSVDDPVTNGIPMLANSTVQGGVIGAGAGAMAPADSNEERLRNMAIGGALGAGAGRIDAGRRALPMMQNGPGGGLQRGQTNSAIRDGLREAGGRSRAPVSIETGRPIEPLPDNLRKVVDASTPIPGVKPSSRADVSPSQARGQLRDDLLRQGDDPQQVDQLIELLGDDAVNVLRDSQLGPAVSRGYQSGTSEGGGLALLVGGLGLAGAYAAIKMAMRDSGNSKATPEDVSRAIEQTVPVQGLPTPPSAKPPLNAFAL